MNKNIILAYSGGLDTTYAIDYLKRTYESEVIALLIDLGEEKDLERLEKRALQAGALRCYVINGQDDLSNEYLSVAIKSNALYEGVYPLISALSRPLIAKYLVNIAHKEKAFAVAHGCTAKGNDQIRFDVSIRALDPSIQVIAPLREAPVHRKDAIAYVAEKGIDISITNKHPYSIDMNIWGRSCECGILEDPWIEPPQEAYGITEDPETASDSVEYVEIEFKKGIPVSLNGNDTSLRDIIVSLNRIAGAHGIGRIDHLENRVVGIKSREVYESPAGLTLIKAHSALESICLTRELAHYKMMIDQKVSDMIYEGMWFSPLFTALQSFIDCSQQDINGIVRLKFYKGQAIVVGRKSPDSLYDFALSTYDGEDTFDHSSAAGFVKIFGLPLEIYANKHLKRR